jgi:hypothetical protein
VNERQRDMFLWQWSRRRVKGHGTVALRGAAIGAAGGLAFALILGSGFGGSGPRDTAWLLQSMGQWAKLLVLSVPAFASIGYLGASRVFRSHEAMYQAILQTGAHVPAQPPVLAMADRGPAIAVGVATAVIGGLVIAAIIFLG